MNTRFHCNSGYANAQQCYVLCTVCTLFTSKLEFINLLKYGWLHKICMHVILHKYCILLWSAKFTTAIYIPCSAMFSGHTKQNVFKLSVCFQSFVCLLCFISLNNCVSTVLSLTYYFHTNLTINLMTLTFYSPVVTLKELWHLSTKRT